MLLLCIQAAAEGGETLLARGAELCAQLPASLLQSFQDAGGIRYQACRSLAGSSSIDPRSCGCCRYVRRYPCEEADPGAALSWQRKTGCRDRDAAVQVGCVAAPQSRPPPALSCVCRQFWRQQGFQEVSFTGDGTLCVANTQPACRDTPDGQVLFSNPGLGTVMAPGKQLFTVCHADSRPIPDEVVDVVQKASWAATCALQLLGLVLFGSWPQRGVLCSCALVQPSCSLLALENARVLHGRLPFSEPHTVAIVLTSD